jgi:hypothetical protein
MCFRIFPFLDEIRQALQILGMSNQQIETIDCLSNHLDRSTFVQLFSLNTSKSIVNDDNK